ncbi:MAG: Ppx/GppA family phosphatase, partial [Candidatus Phaeomarinobacter sp.]
LTGNRTGYEAMGAEVIALLDDRPLADELEVEISNAVENGDIHLLGTSGTVTTIAGIHLGLKRYDRSKVDGIWVDFADVTAVTDGLSIMNFDERASGPCIGKDRADLVLAGCAILEAIQTSWPCERLRVADRGLREGILITLMREERRNQKRKRRRRRGGRGRRKPGNPSPQTPSATNQQ